jgi:hypothetical protein
LLQPYSRALQVQPPDLIPSARAHGRFAAKNKAIVPGRVSSKLPEFGSKDIVARRAEARQRLTEGRQFARRHLVVEVANEDWSHKSEFSAAARSAAPASS